MKFILIHFLFSSTSVLFSQNIVNIHVGQCDSKSNPDFIHLNYLISKTIENDTLFVQLGVVRNCSFKPKVFLSQSGDSLIFELKNSSNTFTACNCCYEIEILITDVQ